MTYAAALGSLNPLDSINALLDRLGAIPGRVAAVRARAAALSARTDANPLARSAARRQVSRTSELARLYNALTAKLRFGQPAGLSAVPLVVIAIVGGVTAAAVVAGIYSLERKIALEEQIIDGLERGTLTPEEVDATARLAKQNDPAAASVFGQVGGLLKTAFLGLGGLLLLKEGLPLLRGYARRRRG